jgi:hypothetical protein
MSTIGRGRSARRFVSGLFVLLGASQLFGCNRTDSEKASEGHSAQSAEAVVEQAIDEATRQAGAEHLFDPSDEQLRKRACDFLTRDLVSKTFDVPAADLRQMKVMGCLYTARKDGQLLDAKLMSIRVHKTAELSRTWFRNATATKTKAELDAEMDAVKKKVQESEKLDTQLEKKTAGGLTDMAKMGLPDEGVSYTDVPDLGDEARVSNADGVVWIRLGNMTFQVSAFHGPDQPKPAIDPKNLKGIAKAAMEAQKKWIRDTLEQRKKDALKLAPKVVAAVEAGAAPG